MRYLSVCSGIEAATVAWHPLEWEAVGFSEIEKFPSRVLEHHYPTVPNLGDMNDFKNWPETSIDVLVGGTPCQSFSVAGLRQGMADPRGNLALVYLSIAEQYRPRWLVWENVPGVLSSNGGRDFGSIVGGMVELGYCPAWRVLDAQYFGVPQRRRRVFIVASARNWTDPAKVLFEPESLRRNPPPSREAREEVAGTFTSRANSGGGGRRREDDHNLVAFAQNQRDEVRLMDKAGALSAEPGAKQQTYLMQGVDIYNGSISGNVAATMSAHAGASNTSGPKLLHGMAVRRLTPLECERLQGFPDNYTNIPGASDSARYKALGNSMAVPAMRWIGQRINSVVGGRSEK